jgi:hypothetical protein
LAEQDWFEAAQADLDVELFDFNLAFTEQVNEDPADLAQRGNETDDALPDLVLVLSPFCSCCLPATRI